MVRETNEWRDLIGYEADGDVADSRAGDNREMGSAPF